MALSLTYTGGNASGPSSGGVYTSSAIASGTAAADRYSIAVMGYVTSGGPAISSVKINGISATKLKGAAAGSSLAEMWWCANPTGTTAVVEVTYAGGVDQALFVALFRITGHSTTIPYTDSSIANTNSPTLTNFQTSSASLFFEAGTSSGQARTWSNATASFDINDGGQSSARATAAISTTVGTASVSVSNTTANVQVLIGVAFLASGTAYSLSVAVGAFAYTGFTTIRAIVRPAARGTYTYTGKAVNWLRAQFSATGGYAYTGIANVMSHTRTLVAAVGTYVYTGIAATLNSVRTMALARGTYALTGQITTRALGFPVAVGTYLYTGFATTRAIARASARGTYALTGQITTRAIVRASAVGHYLYTGFTSTRGWLFMVNTGSYLYSGVAAIVARFSRPDFSRKRKREDNLQQERERNDALYQKRRTY